jgi:hypothetical protein
MADDTEQRKNVVRWPLAGYRKFLSPDEAKAIRDGKKPSADVIELDEKKIRAR